MTKRQRDDRSGESKSSKRARKDSTKAAVSSHISCVAHLPTELMISVSLCLFPLDVLKLARVNRELNETMKDNYMWYQFNRRNWPVDAAEHALMHPWRSMYLKRVKHIMKGKTLICMHGRCTYACRTKDKFDLHMREHQSATSDATVKDDLSLKKQNGRYACDKCSKSYSSKTVLQQHRMKHDGYAFPCTFPGCDRGFKTRTLLQQHVARHEGKALKYVCTYPDCQYSASRRSYLTAHMERHDAPLEKRERVYCRFEGCSTSFSKQYEYRLVRHERLHDPNQVTHDCLEPGCGKRFAIASELHRHIERRHSSKASKAASSKVSRPVQV